MDFQSVTERLFAVPRRAVAIMVLASFGIRFNLQRDHLRSLGMKRTLSLGRIRSGLRRHPIRHCDPMNQTSTFVRWDNSTTPLSVR
jgi:hypothetical protein